MTSISIPFDSLANVFGEAIILTRNNVTEEVTAIVSREQRIIDGKVSTIVRTVDLPRTVELEVNDTVTIAGRQFTVSHKITDNDPGWYRYNLGAFNRNA